MSQALLPLLGGNLFGFLLLHKLSSARVNGCKEEEPDEHQESELSVPQRLASLKVKLCQRSPTCQGLSNQRCSKAQLSHTANKKLILLGEAEALHTKELKGVQQTLLGVLERALLCLLFLLLLLLHEGATGRQNGSDQVEDNQANHQLINLVDVELVVKDLITQLSQGTLASQDLAHQGEGEAKHGSTAHKELVVLSESEPEGLGLGGRCLLAPLVLALEHGLRHRCPASRREGADSAQRRGPQRARRGTHHHFGRGLGCLDGQHGVSAMYRVRGRI
mmetsp:Transcript_5051/g.13710  ORF Transcript_5051/g.13710 Transcript_5051/m.13710 type:complete len:277 (-) Transcript_5051:150-980(-)